MRLLVFDMVAFRKKRDAWDAEEVGGYESYHAAEEPEEGPDDKDADTLVDDDDDVGNSCEGLFLRRTRRN